MDFVLGNANPGVSGSKNSKLIEDPPRRARMNTCRMLFKGEMKAREGEDEVWHERSLGSNPRSWHSWPLAVCVFTTKLYHCSSSQSRKDVHQKTQTGLLRAHKPRYNR